MYSDAFVFLFIRNVLAIEASGVGVFVGCISAIKRCAVG